MLPIVLCVVGATQSVVMLGTGSRATTLYVAKIGRAPTGLDGGADYVRLVDVVSPSAFQRNSSGAAQYMLDLGLGEELTVELAKPNQEDLGDDDGPVRHGRVRIGKVWLHEALVREGWAWVLPSARGNKALVKLEDEARAAKRGLWAAVDPVEPWLWREVLLMTDKEHMQVHAGWECPFVQETKCAKCGGMRVYSLEDAKEFTPHDVCMTKDVLRFAQDSGEPPPDEEEDDTSPHDVRPRKLPNAARRECKIDADCAIAPLIPCTCAGCGGQWQKVARADVVKRMKRNFTRAPCGSVGCPACASHPLGTKAVCEAAQCVIR